MSDLQIVMKTGRPHHGICGPSPLSEIPGFDFVRAFVPEYMHSVCQGVVKLLLVLWSYPKYSKNSWSIRKKIAVINSRLSRTKPPYEMTRVMGAIDDLANWKASMFRGFILFFVDILEDILPAEYFDHLISLSYAMFVLLQKKVSTSDVENMKHLLKRFVIDMEILYGPEHVGINVHFLTHLPQSVLDWGCLWTTSTFIPEWFNGVLMSLSNGTQAVADQMARNYLMKLAVRDEAVNILANHVLPPNVSDKLCDNLHLPREKRRVFSKGTLTNNDTIEALGNPTIRNASLIEKMHC